MKELSRFKCPIWTLDHSKDGARVLWLSTTLKDRPKPETVSTNLENPNEIAHRDRLLDVARRLPRSQSPAESCAHERVCT